MKFEFCPHCGNRLAEKEIGDEGLVPFCTECGIPVWEMFTTSVIAAVVNEYGEIALLRQNYVSETKYVCVAGIMKPGESAEDAVVREVKEELGQNVFSAGYIGSWPYKKKDMLMLGFTADVIKNEFRLSGEVDSAEWVRLEDAPPLLREGGIAWRLVNEVIAWRNSSGRI